MVSSDVSRLIATGIRDALRQHGDIFAAIDPDEVPGQLIARLPESGPAIEAYLKDLNQKTQTRPTILLQRGCLVRDPANSRTLRGFTTDAPLTTVAVATSDFLGAVGDQKGRVLIFRLSKSRIPT